MEGGTTAGEVTPEEQLFLDFRADVARRIENYQSSRGQSQDEDSEFNSTEEITGGALFCR